MGWLWKDAEKEAAPEEGPSAPLLPGALSSSCTVHCLWCCWGRPSSSVGCLLTPIEKPGLCAEGAAEQEQRPQEKGFRQQLREAEQPIKPQEDDVGQQLSSTSAEVGSCCT